MKRLIFITFLVLIGLTSFAQQLPVYSQYLYNKFLINPAHAGSDGYTSFNLTAREQWMGYSGAPRTYSFSWQTRILKKSYQLSENVFKRTVLRPKTDGKAGLGGYVFSDSHGLIKRAGFQVAYSYHLWIDDFTQLSLGLAFTGYHFIINANEVNFDDPNEPWLNNELRKGIFVPDADFGIYLVNPRYDLGLSALQLLGANGKFGDNGYRNFSMARHFCLFGSYSFSTKNKTELEPSVLVKMSEELNPQADIGLTYIFDQSLWVGLSYRTGGALIAICRIKFFPGRTIMVPLFIGYAYDFTLTRMNRATFGTHELTMALKFGDSARKYRWLDRY